MIRPSIREWIVEFFLRLLILVAMVPLVAAAAWVCTRFFGI